ncbi:hypothetical protein K458DRAFT_389087 [Lentithecium fluviatile CBS 122367]|uniref:Uncharacterized protein n=1 Tax=Lentithecium fluviatile CBS 122367 TaxID=1168545 RepID=A0A6G1J281_9PLEO|nr:hypothetical protein K458DRAFT_389087 [Lentithecium fluviatile CBS 122367]
MRVRWSTRRNATSGAASGVGHRADCPAMGRMEKSVTSLGKLQCWTCFRYKNDESKAGELADSFIRNNDMKHENWVQNLYKLIFPGKNPMDFSCTAASTVCGPVPECSEFEAAGYVGGYYVFRSIDISHAYFREFQIQVLGVGIKNALAIDQIVAEFYSEPSD